MQHKWKGLAPMITLQLALILFTIVQYVGHQLYKTPTIQQMRR